MADRPLISFDYAVKYLLRGKDDFVILSGFLSELMRRRVEVTAIIESESNKDAPDDKLNRVDLKAELDGGELAVFEIQFRREYDFFGRVLFGVSKAITEQIKSGKQYSIKKVYSINIAYSNLTAKREYLFYGKFGGFHGVHFEDETIPFAQAAAEKSKKTVEIHPEYYLILPEMFDDELRGKFDEWVYILKHTAVRDDFTAAGIEEAKAKLDYLKMTPAEKKAYDRYMDNRGSLDCAFETAKADGWMEGIEEGMAKGMAKGLEEGEKKGRAEERCKLIKRMREEGFSVADIAKVTKLSEKEVNENLGL